MKIDEIKVLAKEKGVKAGKMKKAELILAIQREEGNEECYNSGKAAICGQEQCLWREDC
ncbi:MAG: SAP domain-containing protein [Geobacter sp.]|nr:SAP domain-containing protein [Geobacter sp.]